MSNIIKYEDVESKILIIRGQYAILDSDIAVLYDVQTKEINQAVKNNPEKFPVGFIIDISLEEWRILKSKILTSSWGGKNKPPKVFTEKGLYMLATILKSPTATQTTIAIINAFANIRELNRIIKQFPNTQDEKEQTSLTARAGDVLWEIFDDSMMEISGKETSMKFKLPFLEVKHTVKREKRKE